MNLEAIAPIIEEIIKETLQEKRYKFGFANHKGVSNKIASGKLRNSVQVQVSENKLLILMEEYGTYVQSGRLPGKKGVPIQPLIEWIKERKITPKKGTIKGMAFGIRTNIMKYGIRPSNFLDISIEKIMEDPRITELLGDAAYEELINAIEGI